MYEEVNAICEIHDVISHTKSNSVVPILDYCMMQSLGLIFISVNSACLGYS